MTGRHILNLCVIQKQQRLMTTTTQLKKPGVIRAIVIMYLFKVFLALGFFFVFRTQEDPILEPMYILYTAGGYALSWVAVMLSILKKSIWGLRIAILVDFGISLPTKAFIGLAIAAVSFGLSFHKKIKAYMGQ
jgi:hypothetical protein